MRGNVPLYEYECAKNGHRFEVIQKFSDPPLKTCTRCRSSVRRLLSAPAISFKGSGWYVTDYARSGANGSGRKEGSKAEPSGGESKGDTKAAAKSDRKGSTTDGTSSS